MTTPSVKGQEDGLVPRNGGELELGGPRLELRPDWRDKGTGSHCMRRGSKESQCADWLPAPALQPPSRPSTGRTSRKPEMPSAELCFLGHRGWSTDQDT